MPRAQWRLFLADLRHRRLQVGLLILSVAVATAGIISGLAQQRSAGSRWDGAFRRANGAHVAIFGAEATLQEVATRPDVVQSADPAQITNVSLRIHDTSLDDVDARAATVELPSVGTPLSFGGRWLRGADDEAVVERSFALDAGIGVGDDIAISGTGGTVTMRVVGVYLDLLDCFYPQCDSATVWVPAQTMSRIDPTGESTDSMLLVRLADPSSVGTFEAQIQNQYGTGVHHVLDWQDTRHDALTVNQFFAAFLAAFGVFLLIAAGLVILSSVSSFVLARYRELGVLKSVGFTPAALTLLILGENLAIAAVGIVIGVLAGGWLAPFMQLQFATVLERGGASYPFDIIVVTIVVVALIITASTVLPAWRSGRLPASAAIARGAAPVSTRPSRLARLARRLGLGTPATMGLKDSAARPLRAWMAILTLVVTIVAITATLGLERTVSKITNDPSRVGDPYDLAIDPGTASRAAIEQTLSSSALAPTVANWFTATDRRGAVGDTTFHVRVLGGDVTNTRFVVKSGRMIERPGEAVAGYGLLDELGLKVGDRLALDLSGRHLDLTLVGWYSEMEDSGRIAQISLDDLRTVEPDASPGGYFVKTNDPSGAGVVRDAVVAATSGTVKVELVDRGADDLDAFRLAFILISLLVLTVALVNVVGTTLVSIRERQRDIGVLKTVGFTPAQVGGSVAAGAAAYAIAAIVIGVPAGLLASAAMQNAVGRGTGSGPGFGAGPSVVALTVAVVAVMACTVALAAVAARRAAQTPVADILRSE